jgi:hypothetical protein
MMTPRTTTAATKVMTRLFDRRADGKLSRRQPEVIAEEASLCAVHSQEVSAERREDAPASTSLIALYELGQAAGRRRELD